MKIAVPIENNRLAAHFGRCPQVMLFTVDDNSGEVVDQRMLVTPPHEPGAFPNWLREQSADVVIAGGMGPKALRLFAQAGIRVVVGAPSHPPNELVCAYLAGELSDGANVCTHEPDHHRPN